MVRRYACNRLYLSYNQYISPCVVTIGEDGKVQGYSPLKEETSATEWIGGVIVLSDKSENLSIGTFAQFFEDTKNAKHADYAWHIIHFDFQTTELTPQSFIRRL